MTALDQTISDVIDITETIRAANRIIAEQSRAIAFMRSALVECEGYFEDRADVIDGAWGRQLPNAEMTLLTEVQTALKWSRP